MVKENLSIYYPKNSPYNTIYETKSGPTTEELKNAKASEFLAYLAHSSYKFSYDSPMKNRDET
jgi:hypothetical protein